MQTQLNETVLDEGKNKAIVLEAWICGHADIYADVIK